MLCIIILIGTSLRFWLFIEIKQPTGYFPGRPIPTKTTFHLNF